MAINIINQKTSKHTYAELTANKIKENQTLMILIWLPEHRYIRLNGVSSKRSWQNETHYKNTNTQIISNLMNSCNYKTIVEPSD